MSHRKRICVVVASRANYARIKSVLGAIEEHSELELQLIVGASAMLVRFGSAIDVIRADGFKPDATTYTVVEGGNPTTMAKSTGLAIIELSTLFENLKPDAVVTVADRHETMATAVAASYMNIPLVHTQGGEVSGSIDESVRHAITKLAHLHFPATRRARDYIVRMGEDPARVFHVGCPALDILRGLDFDLAGVIERYNGTGAPIDLSAPFLLVVQHPVTTEFGSALGQIDATLAAVHASGLRAVWLWPNVDAGSDDVAKGLRMFRETHMAHRIGFFRNFTPEDYARILNGAACIVGNSSSGLREAAWLGVPCVNVGTRQNLRERGRNVVDVSHDAEAILAAIRRQVAHGRYESDPIYGDGMAGKRMADIIAGTDLSVTKRLTYAEAAA